MNSINGNVYIGLMSGTSLDGVDGVLVELPEDGCDMRLLASVYHPFSESIRAEAMALQQPGENEIHREALLANQLAASYAHCVAALMRQAPDVSVRAIGAHGQTIRHRPELGYTRQTNNPALLAELCGTLDVNRDGHNDDDSVAQQLADELAQVTTALASAAPHNAELAYWVADDYLRLVALCLQAWAWTQIDATLRSAAAPEGASRWSAPSQAFRLWVLPEFNMRLGIIRSRLAASAAPIRMAAP